MNFMKRIFLFAVVNLLVILAISFIVSFFHIQPYLNASGIDYQSLLIMCALFGFAGAFISLQMSRWVAKKTTGVVLIDPANPKNATEAKIVKIVTDVCQRARLDPLPEIGIYPSPEINAFATGPSRKRALLAISSGLINRMDDKAIEGVIGHEITHITNGDMVTMTLVQGVVNTFVMFLSRIIAFAIENALERNRDNRGGRGGLGFFAQYILISVLQSVLMLLASPIIYYFSRTREYKADKGSAEMTGRDTMIYALESLKNSTQIRDDRAPALSAFKINGYGHGLMAMLYSTHPPLDARIEALKRG